MSDSNNAFIKAYAEELAVALGRPAKQVDRRAIGVGGPGGSPAKAAGRAPLSGLYASAESQQRAVTGSAALSSRVNAAIELPQVATAPREPKPPLEPASPPAVLGDVGAATAVQPEPAAERIERLTELRVDSAEPMHVPPSHARFEATDAKDHARSYAQAVGQYARGPLTEGNWHARGGEPSRLAREVFRPLWEVDRFRWPVLVDRLLSQGGGLAGIVNRLVGHSHHGTKVLAITSFGRGEGRTTVALCLARLAAGRGVSVVLVDGDHEHPVVATALGISFDLGWDTSADNPPNMAEVAVQSIEDDLSILPLCGNLHRGDASIARARVALSSLSKVHDLVLVDAGPIFTAAHRWFDRQGGRLMVDHALVVRDLRTISDFQLADVVERLRVRDVPILGIAENFQPPSGNPPTATDSLAS
jgi:Mrp family chromosome partitioning ATPase